LQRRTSGRSYTTSARATRQHDCHKGRGQKMAKMSTVTNFVAAIFGFRWVNLALNQRFEAFASCFPINITEHVWSN
ncbi:MULTISPECIES: hypothetical protein, partial [Collinsella]|uniref:hypothetical protein n=1 Tax=Collinsella TaxID=102106 RepID=UPI001C9E724D